MANIIGTIPSSQLDLCAQRAWWHIMKSALIAGFFIEEHKTDLQITQTGYLLENGCLILEVTSPVIEKVICSTEFLPNEFKIKCT